MSNMFSDDNLTEENKERDLTVLFLSSVKELICIYNILNIKDGVRPQFYRTDDIEELFNDNRITTLDIKGSTDNFDSLMMIETFRRKVTKEQYYMFLMAIKSDDTMADKFMDIILECSS